MSQRFLTLADVAETLNVSAAQTYALVRAGELRAMKVGGRGQWRVETSELEAYIDRSYAQTADFVLAHPLGESGRVGLSRKVDATSKFDDADRFGRNAHPGTSGH